MAFHGKSYGLDAELQAKRTANYDQGLENEVRKWMEGIVGEKIGSSFHEGLKSGVFLVTLVNKLRPGICKPPQKAKAPFVMMENINSFLEACKKIGVPVPDLFMTVDLFEAKNMNQVLQTILGLRRKVEGKVNVPVPKPPVSIPGVTPAPAPKSTSVSRPKFCSGCGEKLGESDKFCCNCGTKI